MIKFHKKSDLTKIERELAKIAKFLSLDVPIEIDMQESYINKEDDYELVLIVHPDLTTVDSTINPKSTPMQIRCCLLNDLFDWRKCNGLDFVDYLMEKHE